MTTKALRVRCSAKKSNGEPCTKWAIRGGTVCQTHGGGNPKVKANAAVRAEVFDWGFTDKTDKTEDPGEILLKLVTQSAHRAQRYADELEKLIE